MLCQCTSVLQCFHSQQPAPASLCQGAALRLHKAQLFLHAQRADSAWELISPPQPQLLAKDWWVWEYKCPSSLTPDGIVCDETHMSPNLSTEQLQSYFLWGFAWHPTLVCLTFILVPGPHCSRFFWEYFLSQESCDSETNSTFYLKILFRRALSHNYPRACFWGTHLRKGHFFFFLESFQSALLNSLPYGFWFMFIEKNISYSVKPCRNWLSLRQKPIFDLISCDWSCRVMWNREHRNLCIPFIKGFGHTPWQPLWVWETESQSQGASLRTYSYLFG